MRGVKLFQFAASVFSLGLVAGLSVGCWIFTGQLSDCPDALIYWLLGIVAVNMAVSEFPRYFDGC